MHKPIITIGYSDEGEEDFEVSGHLANLSYADMTKLRAMIVVAIGTAESMWRGGKDIEQKPTINVFNPDIISGVTTVKLPYSGAGSSMDSSSDAIIGEQERFINPFTLLP